MWGVRQDQRRRRPRCYAGAVSGSSTASTRRCPPRPSLGSELQRESSGMRPPGRRVLDPEGEEAYGDVLEAGQELAKSGADVVVVGCTGMTRLRARLQGEPGLPVVELCQAAIIFAASALRDAYTERDRPLDRLNADIGPRDDCCDAPGRGLEHRSAFDPYLDGFVCCVRSSGVALPGVMGEANRMTEVEPTRGRERHRHRRREGSGHRRGIGGHLSMPGRADGGRLRSVRRRRNSDDCSRPAVG